MTALTNWSKKTWLLCLALSCGVADLAAVEVKSVRGATDQGRTRVVFDMTGSAQYSLFTLRNPERIVLDFDDLQVNQPLALPAKGTAGVSGLRYSRRGKSGLRIVLDLEHAMAAKDLRLPPSGSYGHRLVVDLTAVSSPTPYTQPPTNTQIAKSPSNAQSTAALARAPQTSAQAQVAPRALMDNPNALPTAGGAVSANTSPAATPLAAGDSDEETGSSTFALDISGRVGAEARVFFQDPRFPAQPGETGSISIQPEFYGTWADGKQSLLFIPFLRLDENDKRRTHADLRELSYIYAATEWELRAGVRKVFWGVAESNHLIDVINQTDLIENLDTEDKLGQPMVNLALIRDWGTVDLFVLPGFRERTFPGRKGRFQGPLRIVPSQARYESAAGNDHIDYAARYSHYFDVFDVGLSHFWGTSREPRFAAKVTPAGEPILFPIYDLIHQTSADVQATVDNWLFKFEGLRRQGQGETYVAAISGFEYTYVGVFESAIDVGVIGEYHWDERGKSALSPFNDDLFFGSRLAFNDAADSQVLGGMFSDLNGGGHFLNLEASRRFGEHWKAELELRLLLDIKPTNPLFAIAQDDYIQLEVLRFF